MSASDEYGDEIATEAEPDIAKHARHDGLSLRVVGEGLFATHLLPKSGAVVIGRAAKADVRIEHASISRLHARLHAGARLFIEDLESANGTRVRGRRIEPGERVEIAPGDVIDLGSVMFVVQPGAVERTARKASRTVEGGALERLQPLIARVASSQISVLILGETGVGKELVAEAIHRASPRAAKPLLQLNCAALADSLLESELFGYEKGAFTGAASTRSGLIETAHGGTLFLDELGEMPLSLQAKLLRVIETRQVLRVGGREPRHVDVRFVSATHRDLEAEIAAGRFRQDLYFRLNGMSIVVPPLRERVSEIAGLARAFLDEAARQASRPAPRLSPEGLAQLERRPWPGNIRELRNTIERALLLCAGDTIRPEDLAVEKPAPPRAPSAPLAAEFELERQRILDALEQAGGNQSRAAKALGISRGTLHIRLETYRVPRPRKRSPFG